MQLRLMQLRLMQIQADAAKADWAGASVRRAVPGILRRNPGELLASSRSCSCPRSQRTMVRPPSESELGPVAILWAAHVYAGGGAAGRHHGGVRHSSDDSRPVHSD